MLRQTWFTPASWGEALFLPPVGVAGSCSAMAWERVGAALSLPFAGVHIVEATKQVYRAIPARRERTRLISSLEPVLVPSSTATREANLMSPRKGGGPDHRPIRLDRSYACLKGRLRRMGHASLGPPYASRYLLIPRIEIFARAGPAAACPRDAGHVAGGAGAGNVHRRHGPLLPAGRAIHLRLRAGDEGGQAIDAAGIGNHRLRPGLRLILRLRTVLAFAMVFARLLEALRVAGRRRGLLSR